jgi:hypothetical protein
VFFFFLVIFALILFFVGVTPLFSLADFQAMRTLQLPMTPNPTVLSPRARDRERLERTSGYATNSTCANVVNLSPTSATATNSAKRSLSPDPSSDAREQGEGMGSNRVDTKTPIAIGKRAASGTDAMGVNGNAQGKPSCVAYYQDPSLCMHGARGVRILWFCFVLVCGD